MASSFKIELLLLGLLLSIGILCLLLSTSNKPGNRFPHSLLTGKNNPLNFAANILDGDNLSIHPPPVPTVNRTPLSHGFKKYTSNMFSYDKIAEAVHSSSYPADVERLCLGPVPNIDVYIKEAHISPGFGRDGFGLNVFALDCRGPYTSDRYRLFGFVIVMDMFGKLVNALSWNEWGGSEVECVSMFNTTTVLFSTLNAAYHWDYTSDVLEQLPFASATHTLVYRYSDNEYYGILTGQAGVETAVAFDGVTGQNSVSDAQYSGWSFFYQPSHFNYLSVDGNYAYGSTRQLSTLIKVDMQSNQVLWSLGGFNSNFTIYNTNGIPYPKVVNKNDYSSIPWGHQHKFQPLGDGYFSLFDNNIGNDHTAFTVKPWGTSSRVLILLVNEQTMEAWEIFSYPVGDNSMSYGCAEILPSGNILSNSYVDWVYPADEDHQYHVNMWEISPITSEPVWRIAFKGLNYNDPQDFVTPYRHVMDDPINPSAASPLGWNIYNVVRVYPTVLIKDVCIGWKDRTMYVQFTPFNTIRTQSDAPGTAVLSLNGEVLSKIDFYFHRAWLIRPQQIFAPNPDTSSPQEIILSVSNQWNDVQTVALSSTATSSCSA